ncbi:hypothetical protein CFN79_16130 [Chromobacterium vaccinii]|uniref:hypothetical protein n=1 Tax=Chromobacterium vaccinii TaxID=1108595 RepID=UPI000CE996AD|nr:hypothetical protein CFN79_16130 [Chromobacterium vaccinii]
MLTPEVEFLNGDHYSYSGVPIAPCGNNWKVAYRPNITTHSSYRTRHMQIPRYNRIHDHDKPAQRQFT